MSATYNLFSNPSKEGEKEKDRRLHARLVNQQTIRIDRLCEEISDICSFSSSDIKGMLEALRSRISFHLRHGDIVELEGLGTFAISLQCPPLTEEKEIKPQMVRFNKVVFRGCKGLKAEFAHIKMERANEGSRIHGLTEETRITNILHYLAKETTISTSECRAVNGCSKYTALKDINSLLTAGKIVKLGRKSNAQYALAEETERIV